MSSPIALEFDRPPAIAPAFARAALKFSASLADGATIAPIEARVAQLRVDPRHLANYAKVCGFGAGDSLPVTYPHVLAFPVHMAVLTHREFPLPLMGLVHVRNEITQLRPIDQNEPLGLRVRVDGHREVQNGIEFDLATAALIGGEVVWESESTMLARGKGTGKRSGGKKQPPAEPAERDHSARWSAPGDIGRRYALAAGDFNPIHLSALSAKLFGFARAIAHGMWLKARTAAALADVIEQPAYTFAVAFKKPVLLPGELQLDYRAQASGVDFALIRPGTDAIHMLGELTYR